MRRTHWLRILPAIILMFLATACGERSGPGPSPPPGDQPEVADAEDPAGEPVLPDGRTAESRPQPPPAIAAGTAPGVVPPGLGVQDTQGIWQLGCPSAGPAAISPGGVVWASLCTAGEAEHLVAVDPATGGWQLLRSGPRSATDDHIHLRWVTDRRLVAVWVRERGATGDVTAEMYELGRPDPVHRAAGAIQLTTTPLIWAADGVAFVATWGEIHRLDLAAGKLDQVLPPLCADSCRYPAVAPDGQLIFMNGLLFDVAAGRELQEFRAMDAAWSRDGSLLAFPAAIEGHASQAIQSEGGQVLYSAAVLVVDRRGQTLQTLTLPDGLLTNGVAWSPDESAVLVSAAALAGPEPAAELIWVDPEHPPQLTDQGLFRLGLDDSVRPLRPGNPDLPYPWWGMAPPRPLPGLVLEGERGRPPRLTSVTPAVPLPPGAEPDQLLALAADTLAATDPQQRLWICVAGDRDCSQVPAVAPAALLQQARAGCRLLISGKDGGLDWVAAIEWCRFR